MDEWVFWILTCGFSLYFVVLLLEFNRPSQKLMEQIDNQEARRQDMQRRLSHAQEQTEEMKGRFAKLEHDMDDLEAKRKDILPEANKRLMVHIPAGPFTMGGRDEDSPRSERPAHTIYQSAYYIGKTPVTNQDYREFVQCTGHRAPIHWQRGTFPPGAGKHPVVNVSWQDARDYADWRSARLPTESEWEKAARGTDERPYPWGTRFTEGERCNANNQIGTTTPVDEWPDGLSFYGVWDMAGNVYEWCYDHYDPEYYKDSPTTNPKGADGGQERVIRGGSYQETRAALRTTHRMGSSEVSTRDNIGFRLALDADDMRPGS
ncbi:MAG: SUMF1/EgtB/PvdO family nonheme iron enzyme [Candidatus Latescibacteria bacterium]|jgi:formylglycine-generating enzyme required for sulfatase activity|nr:SUMF1/EgtB/PvdO family nonheme iron enzyme [Candidatus Latescibacterota bacterium]